MVKLSKIASTIRVLFMIFTITLLIGITCIMIVTLVLPTEDIIYKYYFWFVLLDLVFQFIFIELIVRIIWYFDKNKILIDKTILVYKNQHYSLEEIRVFYYRFNLHNIISLIPGKLSIIVNNKEVILGRYLACEIMKSMSNIKHVNYF